MEEDNAHYIFPELERTLFTKVCFVLLLMELLLHGWFIGSSVMHHSLDGVWLSLFFALIFGFVHFDNLRLRKYCLAKWSFDGTSFHVYIKDTRRSIEIEQPFCVSTTMLSFSRPYSSEKYPFIMIWKPGKSAPHEEMNGYNALALRDALIIPHNEKTLEIFRNELRIRDIPLWPKSGVYAGIAEIKSDC